jgi:hypothetical protein
MRSRYVAERLGSFLGKIAYNYARYGYHWYAVREIPEGKDLGEVDRKILTAYGVTYQHMRRKRRRAEGWANVAYVRYGRWFILLGTTGRHESFTRICRKHLLEEPLYFGGYIVALHDGEVTVLVSPRRWKRIRELAHRIALHNEAKVFHFFHTWLDGKAAPFSFPGVMKQKTTLLAEVNTRRRVAGLTPIPPLVWRTYERKPGAE